MGQKKMCNRDFFVVFRIFWKRKWVELMSLLFFFTQIEREKLHR